MEGYGELSRLFEGQRWLAGDSAVHKDYHEDQAEPSSRLRYGHPWHKILANVMDKITYCATNNTPASFTPCKTDVVSYHISEVVIEPAAPLQLCHAVPLT